MSEARNLRHFGERTREVTGRDIETDIPDGNRRLANASCEATVDKDDPQLSATKFGVSLLSALFAEADTVILRPIESWTEGGRKRSQVDYNRTYYPKAVRSDLGRCLLSQIQFSEHTPVNLYFGVCPRFGGGGQFDLAWQIRVVRALWSDIDHVTVAAALAALESAKLPKPSAVVNSGNGVHFYWLLDGPYAIDDVGDPPAVHIEWRKDKHGRNRPHKFILQGAERVFLEQRPLLTRLSPKALAIQDTLAGIAQAIRGDHTTDLSRILRVPGTLNRKDQRNGNTPAPSILVECDPERRYPLSAFDDFKKPAPESKRAQQIALMPLPTPKKISGSKSDNLSQRIAACAVAEVGDRSEADFALCCYAIRNGIEKSEVWGQVSGVGKFSESGETYFELTWSNAEQAVRIERLDQLLDKRPPAPTSSNDSNTTFEACGDGDDIGPHRSAANDRPTIVVEPATTPLGETLDSVTLELLQHGDYFIRADQLVEIHGDRIFPVLSAAELAGQLSRHVEFFFQEEKKGEYKPLPATYATTWLCNPAERARLPAVKLYTRNPLFSEDWRLMRPGYDAASGIYYSGTEIAPSKQTTHLDAMLADFCFKQTADRTNYIGILLTMILIVRFIGSKPAALFNGNQSVLGKSMLAQIIAILRDGQHAETATYNPNDEEFEKRLGAIVRNGHTTIIIDNAKARGRRPRIESPCLERSITDHTLSFRLLGVSDSIRAENSHIFAITANSAEVSRDLLTRSVVVNLYYEGDPARRAFRIADPEGYALEYRSAILGELIGMVDRWKAAGMPHASTHSRFNKRGWGDIVGGILEVCGEHGFLDNADASAVALDETRREFAELVTLLAYHQQPGLPSSELVRLCVEHGLLTSDLGQGSSRSRATKMGTLASRFVNDRFALADGRTATFKCGTGRKGVVYWAEVAP